MATNNIHRKLPQLLLWLAVTINSLGANVLISGFVPTRSTTTPMRLPTNGRSEVYLFPRISCLRAAGTGDEETNHGEDNNKNNSNEEENDDESMINSNGFFFDMSKTNIDSRSSMDVGIYEMLGSGGGGPLSTSWGGTTNTGSSSSSGGGGGGELTGNGKQHSNHHDRSPLRSNTVVVMDWECILDALPYHIELGIHAARTTWPHLNDLCNFDTDREWLENKLIAMSHVLGSPEGPDKSRHVACEFALATRLILEEQALDRNESTGKNGKYARRFHPRSEINGNNEFEEDSRSRRPLTAGELAVNWREFIRSTLIVKYARGVDGKLAETEPLEALEQAIEDYLLGNNSKSKSAVPTTNWKLAKSLPLFPQTKFALRNSSTKLVVRISHKFDNDIVARSLNKHLRLLPHERIAKTYKPENAIRRLFLNHNKNIVLLLKPDYKYEFFNPNETTNDCQSASENILGSTKNYNKMNEENCLKDIMKITHQCGNSQAARSKEQQQLQQTEDEQPTTPSIVWVDSSWHRLQGLAPVFGDTIPGGRNGSRNTARCSVAKEGDEIKSAADTEIQIDNDNDNDNDNEIAQTVWLSLWLAEWPSKETSGSSSSETTKRKRIFSSSENHQAAMVYPWTDSLSWDDAEGILMPTTWGSSNTAFQ